MNPADSDHSRADKRLAISQAALREFRDRGFSSTRVEDICRAAGIAKGTYYLYFSSKEEVLLALFEGVVEGQAPGGDLLSPDPVDRLLGIVDELLKQGQARLDTVPVFWEVAGDKVVQSKCDLNGRIKGVFEGLTDQIRGIILRGQESGEITATIDADAFAPLIVNSIDGIILHAAIFYRGNDTYLENQKQELITMIRSHLKPATLGGDRV